MMKQRTFVECLRYNIEHNWNEGGLFESMTKDDCMKACDKIEQLQVKNKRMKKALQAWIEVNEGAPNKYQWAKEALEGGE